MGAGNRGQGIGNRRDDRALHVMASIGEAILIPALAAGVIGQGWLCAAGIEPPIPALAGAVILSKPLALMIVAARDRRRHAVRAVALRHLLRLTYVFLSLFLLVILLWVIADRRYAWPLVIGCVGAFWSLVLAVGLHAARRHN